MKKIICCLLVSAMLLGFTAGCGKTKTGDNASQGSGTDTPTTQLEPKIELTMMTQSHPSWPYKEDWWIWKAIEEKTNVKLNITAVANSNYAEKLSIAMASGSLPDIVIDADITTANKNGALGAYADVKQYLKIMPNLSKWIKKYPAEYEKCISADGKVYAMPNEGMGETNRRFWMYREDIFKKNDIKTPANCDDLYQALVKLKQVYPDSYPLAFRAGIGQFSMIAPQWGTGSSYYYDEGKKEWRYGPVEANYKEMVVYYNKLYKEKLIPPDFLTLDTKQWQDIISTSKAFVTLDYNGRIDFFNNAMRKEIPDYKMAFLPPPAGGKNGKSIMAYSSILVQATCVNSKSKNLDRAMKLMDWLYSDDGYQTISWGKEGETYKIENNEKKFINVKEVADIRNLYGISTVGTYLWYDYTSHMSTFSKELNAAIDESKKYDEPQDPTLAFTDAENEIITTVGDSINKAMTENIAKFVVGTRSIDEWDKYVEEINKLGLSKMLDTYKKAHDRLLQSK